MHFDAMAMDESGDSAIPKSFLSLSLAAILGFNSRLECDSLQTKTVTRETMNTMGKISDKFVPRSRAKTC